MITWDQVILVQLAAQFFVLVALKLFNILIIILKFSIKNIDLLIATALRRLLFVVSFQRTVSSLSIKLFSMHLGKIISAEISTNLSDNKINPITITCP